MTGPELLATAGRLLKQRHVSDRLIRAAAPLPLVFASAAAAQTDPPVTPADLRRHIEVLASDEFRAARPAPRARPLTIDYIAEQLRARGLEPAGEGGTWFQPVRPGRARGPAPPAALDRATAGAVDFDQATIVLHRPRGARDASPTRRSIFAGHGVRMPDRGIDQLAGADLSGAVVLILLRRARGAGLSRARRAGADGDRGRRRRGDRDRRRRHALELDHRAADRRGTTRLDDARCRADRRRRCRWPPPQRLIAAAGGDFEPAAERPARLLLPRRRRCRCARLDRRDDRGQPPTPATM